MIIVDFVDISQIVDSIMALFRVDFSGRGELADRQQKLAQMLSRLQKISEGILYSSILMCGNVETVLSAMNRSSLGCRQVFIVNNI